MKKILFFLLFLVINNIVFSQQGTIRGQILDEETAEELIGVSVVINGTTTGTITDLDGSYALKLNPGTYTVVYSYISYTTQKITDVVVKDGETTIVDIRLKTDEEQIEEVVVKAERITNSEVAMLTIQRKSANVLDGISAQTFSKTGDNDAASAIKRVTGVSVEGGKYVYVRGLGDRYTKTQLNGVDIPGLDPDRNTVQMDIFPSNLLNNIVVYKTFTPDLPGDFTGGMVNVETKSFPTKETFSFSLGLGYTIGMNLNKNALRYKGGAGTAFGFGNKYRQLPFDKTTDIPNKIEKDPYLTELTGSFSRQLAATNFTSPLNGSFSISKGNQINKEKFTIGYNTAFNYTYNYTFYKDYEFGRARRDTDKDNYELLVDQSAKGSRSNQEIQWSALVGGAIKKQRSKYVLNLLHTQSANSGAAFFNITYPANIDGKLPTIQHVLDYSQRSVSNLLLSGEHTLKNNTWKMEWKLSPTLSKINEPDIRSTPYQIEDVDNDGINDYVIENNTTPLRFFRKLSEVNTVAKYDVDKKFKIWKNLETSLKFGTTNTYKFRNYEILSFEFESALTTGLTGNGDELMEDDYLWTPTNQGGTYVQLVGSLDKNSNAYTATQNIAALYVMNELPITPIFKAIYGLRFERTDNWISGYGRLGDDAGNREINAEKVLTSNDFLPALNLIYNVRENMNLRLSYSKTLARPSFKEKSFVSILDPLSGVRFNGNIDLEITHIQNLDLRWEYFMKQGQMISLSGFYKHFKNPIEISAFEVRLNDVTPRNAGKAHVFGAELEFRKDFGFITPALKNLSLATNLTYVKSMLDMRDITVGAGDDGIFNTADDVSEYELREKYIRNGEKLGYFRDMFGQSPYIVNVALNYDNDSIGFEANLSYNVQGKRLAIVGIGVRPDVYDQPFHSLNFKASQTFGKNKRWKGSLSVQNIIGDVREKLYQPYKAEAKVFERYKPSRSFSIKFSYLIN